MKIKIGFPFKWNKKTRNSFNCVFVLLYCKLRRWHLRLTSFPSYNSNNLHYFWVQGHLILHYFIIYWWATSTDCLGSLSFSFSRLAWYHMEPFSAYFESPFTGFSFQNKSARKQLKVRQKQRRQPTQETSNTDNLNYWLDRSDNICFKWLIFQSTKYQQSSDCSVHLPMSDIKNTNVSMTIQLSVYIPHYFISNWLAMLTFTPGNCQL